MRQGDERSLEEVYRSAVSGLYARLRSNYDFLYRRFGEEGLKLIAEMSREYGQSIARRGKERLPDTSLDSVAGYLVRIFETVGRGKNPPEIVEDQGTRVVVRVRRCPLDFENPEMCQSHTAMERAVVEDLNPEIAYRIGRSIPAGDEFCEHIIELKAVGKKGGSE